MTLTTLAFAVQDGISRHLATNSSEWFNLCRASFQVIKSSAWGSQGRLRVARGLWLLRTGFGFGCFGSSGGYGSFDGDSAQRKKDAPFYQP